MAPSRVHFSGLSVHWATPKSLYAALNKEFSFTLDPCPLGSTTNFDHEWRGDRVFCNPPYGPLIGRYLAKAHEAALAVFLLPARTDTIWFHEYCLKAKEIRFLKGRLKFGDGKGRATFPSMVVVFKESEEPHP